MTANINQHLSKVEDDQLVNGIDTIENTQRNDAGRRFAISQMLQPVYLQGYYNPTTGRYVNGDWRTSMVPNSAFTTVSAAAFTLTCPAGHRYKVYYAGGANATQATNITLSGNIGGNALASINDADALPDPTTSFQLVMPSTFSNNGAAYFGTTSPKYIWLNAGDTLTLTIGTYGAGNDTEHVFLFEDYEV